MLGRLSTSCSVFIAVFAVALVAAANDAFAQSADARIRAHLAAGEFGPAIKIARDGAPAQRDQWLGDIASAQAGVGARRAALGTLFEMGDDRARSSALAGVSGQPTQGWPTLGGGSQADFDSLIELITTTVAPDSWDEVGGPGAIDSFEGGVYVDSAGVLRRLPIVDGGRNLAEIRESATRSIGNRLVFSRAPLRKVSLTRLERAIQMRRALGLPPTEAMQHLAGMQKLKYIFIYPESGDIVLAGPAEGWRVDDEGRTIGVTSSLPVLRLDDFVVVLRNALEENGRFGCSITPTQEGLARAKAFNAESSNVRLTGPSLDRWLGELQASLGKQNIDVYGIDPRTRASRVLVEADYRMKLVGMGLEDGVHGVTSYLDSIHIPRGGSPPALDVLRWWFTLNYKAVAATEGRNGFELRGPGVKVMSENELLTERGERVHTGASNELNQQFADSFTRQFESLSKKYPIYAELRNVFDLALAAALIVNEDLPAQVDWHMTAFADRDQYQVELGEAPQQVDSVMNHRVIVEPGGRRKHLVAGVSGGVSVDTSSLAQRSAIETDEYGLMQAEHKSSTPQNLPRDAWWWD